LAAALVLTVGGCGGRSTPTAPAASPSAPAGPTTPFPTGATSGRITDPQAAADIVVYNQDAVAGSSLRRRGVITRWELPVPVYADPGLSRPNVERAMEYWRSLTGITFVLKGDDEPRILVRTGTDGLGGAAGRGLVDAVYPDNRARSGLVVLRPDFGPCDFAQTSCAVVYEHELGHALGMLDHVAGGGIMSGGTQASQREIRMLVELYRLPHGAKVAPDGTWAVTP
jgi:hypothetical protein